jgi:hypothetical protein
VSKLPALISSITADGLAILMGQPPTATISELLGVGYQEWQNEKARTSHEILFTELKSGKQIASDVDRDSFFGLLHRYLNATKQGAARRNLRLMAQVIKGSLEQDCPFTPDKLAANAELVAGLSRDEIRFLAVFWRNFSSAPVTETGQVNNIEVENRVLAELVPHSLPDAIAYRSIGASLLRTGLIYSPSGWDASNYAATPRLAELMKLCEFEAILDS